MKRKEKDIEKAALKYFKNLVNEQRNSYYNIFKAGVEWADKHPTHYDKILEEFEKNRLEHCDNITKEQYDLERNFVNSHLKKHHRIPTILDAIEYGIEKGKEEMLDKVCKWLEENAGSYLLYPFREYDKGALLEDFKKAMKE